MNRLFSFWTALVLTGHLGVGAGVAAADPPHVEAPKAIDTPAPLAPDGIEGEPVVVLDLLVGLDGMVTSATVIEGGPPFAELARQASLDWKFAPATRDGVAVSAKIRIRVELRRRPKNEPPVVPSLIDASVPLVVNPPSDAGVAAPHPDADVAEDVVVRGSRPLAPHVHLLASEVRELPGAFGDAFRAIEAMPGVVPIVSGLPYFVIRGALPGNTGFLIDGIPVPALFHFGVGEAVISPGLIHSVDLFPAVYPARYGRFAGGILSGDTVPPADKFHGEAEVRILDTGALVEAPFANGHGDVLLAGRYGYPGLILSIVEPSVGLQYWDYQGRVGYRFDDGSHIGVFAFGSFDSVSTAVSGNGPPLQQVLGIEFDRVGVRYTRPTKCAGELAVELIVGRDKTEAGASPPLTLESQTYSLGESWTLHPDERTRVRIGTDAVYQPYNFGCSNGSGASAGGASNIGAGPGGGPSSASGGNGNSNGGNNSNNGDNGLGGFIPTLPCVQNDFTMGAYAELETKLTRRMTAEFGARVDLFTATYPGAPSDDPTERARAVPAFDPRVTLRYALSRSVSLVSAIGTAHQASNIPLPIPALSFSQLGRGLQVAYQASEGVEATLPLGFSATATVFGNDFAGLAQLTNDCGSNATTACEEMTVHGRAYGLELLLRRSLTEKLSGWLSYTLSRSERDSYDGETGVWGHRLSEFDRTHVVNVIGAYDLGRNWRAGARVVAYSGWPYSTNAFDATPNARMPAFYRLDIRLEKRWPKTWGHVSFIAEWLNVLMRKEDIGTQSGINCPAGQQVCPEAIGPITIPSLGVEFGF